MCVWDKVTGQLENPEAAKFILVHELAHVSSTTWGHDKQFWANFKALLEMAEILGAYNDQGHTPDKTYCGHRIGRSPAACVLKKTCDSALLS